MSCPFCRNRQAGPVGPAGAHCPPPRSVMPVALRMAIGGTAGTGEAIHAQLRVSYVTIQNSQHGTPHRTPDRQFTSTPDKKAAVARALHAACAGPANPVARCKAVARVRNRPPGQTPGRDRYQRGINQYCNLQLPIGSLKRQHS